MEPETAHNFVLHIAKMSPFLGKISGIKENSSFALRVGSINWKFPIGLAAGLDKNAEALDFFHHQGFGCIECGTVTRRAQDGNPRPRMFRYLEEQSLRNSMGFPNKGVIEILKNLQRYEGSAPIGVNIGKNKDTSSADSIEELSLLLATLKEFAQYFVINVSSPNTPGLRAMQEKTYLSELFHELNKVRGNKDLYLKIAPDLEENKVIELTHLAEEFRLTGIIATNTTIIPERGQGGVSGRLLKKKARTIQKTILKERNSLELISVGGITDPEDLFELWRDGGKAAQIYSAYIFQGPDLLKKFSKELSRFTHFQQLSLQAFFNLNEKERIYRLSHFKY